MESCPSPRRLLPALLASLLAVVPAAAQSGREDDLAARRARFAPRRSPSAVLDAMTIHVGSRSYEATLIDRAAGETSVLGLEYDARGLENGLGFEGAIFYSRADGLVSAGGTLYDLDFDVIDFMAGGRYTHRIGHSPVYGFCGGGLDVLWALGDVDRTASGVRVSDGLDELGLGAYLHAGLYVVTRQRWVIGLDVRQTLGTEILSGPLEAQMESLQLSLVVGTGR